ncbi:MAG: hypothetical protein ACLFPW_02715 [Spirochaetaceae bacterium]
MSDDPRQGFELWTRNHCRGNRETFALQLSVFGIVGVEKTQLSELSY